MKKHQARKATPAAKASVKDLAPRNTDKTKGGGAISQALKAIGGATQSAASKG